MSFTAAFLMIAQVAAPVVADAPAVRSGPVAEVVTASARVLRPALIKLTPDGELELTNGEQVQSVQRGRDAAGTVWIEFS